MPTHVWTVLCTKSTTDRNSNNMSLFEVIEQLNVQRPAQHAGERAIAPMQSELITLWTRNDPATGEEGTGRLTHLDTDGTELMSSEFEIDLSANRRVRCVARFTGLPVSNAGVQRFRVELQEADGQWRQVAQVPLEVNVGAGDAGQEQ